MLNIIRALPTGVTEDNILQYANTLDKTNFERLLDYVNSEYHNNESIISDRTFDFLVDLYEEKYAPYEVIGAEPTGEKVDLPYFLGGLNKVKEDTGINRYLTNYPGPYIIMDKVDGITVLFVHYLNGVNKLYTRGKGYKGVDISHLLNYVKFPPLNFNYDISIRGELVMSKEVFSRIGKGHANARNMLSGKVIAKQSFNPNIVKELSFYAYRIMNGNLTPEEDIKHLINMGFLVPNPILTQTITKDLLETYLEQRKQLAAYEIDGLVIYQNKTIDYPKDSNPKQVIAFKGKTPTATAKVTNVIWEGSRGKKLKPVVIYEPTLLSGATLTNATAHNARFIVNGVINVGALIKITRSGDSIPTVLYVIEPSPYGPSYPDPAVVGKYNWNSNQVELVLEQDNDEVIAARLEHFLNVLGVDKVGRGRIKTLVKAGIKNIYLLTTMTPNWLITIEGFGDKLSNDVCNDIQTKIKNVPLAKLMDASGIFYGNGAKRTEQLVETYPDILQFVNMDPKVVNEYISAIPGFGPILAEGIVKKLPAFVQWLQQHPQITIGAKQVVVQQYNVKRLDGMTIVISGTTDKGIRQEITSRGGKIGTGVSKNTTMLIMKDTSDIKGKAQDALRLGIPILSIEEFKSKYL